MARLSLLAFLAFGLAWLPAGATIAAGPELSLGDSAVVVGTGGASLRVRSGPGLTYDIVGTLPEGVPVRVLAGPSTDGDETWYQVRAADGGTASLRGWVASTYLASPNRLLVKESALLGGAGARKLLARVCSYTSGGGIGFFTATGTRVHWGTVAVDPKVISLGSLMSIESLDGTFIAEDTGGAVIGAIVDVWFPDATAAARFGTQQRTVTIIREGY